MPKAKAHPDQVSFDFDAPAPAKGFAGLAGLERRICETVGSILASDFRSRAVIAAEMSDILDENISVDMLNAYSSPARTEHRVPMSRFFALLVVTGRQDQFRPLLREIGISGLLGDEVKTARLGQLQQVIAEAQAEMRQLKGNAPKIKGKE
ncbi:MAG: hypothetical protein IE933_03430 [Sphingomonadales bacterium]|nr:hypothetical protein [Sphingomonadales bacterium]MBD3772093.1 hypothetical protein [Paracoccaceae bacterium]